MVPQATSDSGGPPRVLRAGSPARQSCTGQPTSSPPQRGAHRASSPGQISGLPSGLPTGSPGSSSQCSVAVSLDRMLRSSGSFNTNGSPHTSGDMRLPAVSESGEKGAASNGRPAAMNLRRATGESVRPSLHNINPNGRELNVSVSSNARDSPPGESAFLLKKERAALQQDKSMLLLNKRRLEALLNKVLDGPGKDDEGGMNGSRGGSPGQSSPALDESTGLEKQLGGSSPTHGGGGQQSSAEADARVRELTAKISEMQLDHEVAVNRLEGELQYRRTQAAAAASGLQKQLSDAEEEVAKLRQQLASVEGSAREQTNQNMELRKQLQNMGATLSQRTQEVTDVRAMLGMDKTTMNTVIEMLKEQLREANAEKAAKTQRIAELEYAVVHRDALLAHAEQRYNNAMAAGSNDARSNDARSNGSRVASFSSNAWGPSSSTNAGTAKPSAPLIHQVADSKTTWKVLGKGPTTRVVSQGLNGSGVLSDIDSYGGDTFEDDGEDAS
ncbi:hypothetical protein TSOC_005213 [Tetrabaena socialis]|uniref:Uncharacterized protein n=1 Tax=Tetrabaena socialis TaxID=47790 RepID=A0A2J8A6W9_9CHLO|nr:hypothetical protein TSOC_005213 [Tetrabaena socialis]|eukprot:PNH08233.1 hypothetical protein TSOC_005213 [Tetrabaena socialis]